MQKIEDTSIRVSKEAQKRLKIRAAKEEVSIKELIEVFSKQK